MFPRKKEITIEGKMMASEGIDASQGKVDENADEWMPAVGRSTHRRFLRRKARRESKEAASADDDHQHGTGENTSDIYASVDILFMNDDSSEQSSTVRSLSELSVACITGDFAMENVILQMGLRLLAPGGMQIHQLKRWILKCHGCNTMTAETGRMFCPKCGSGATLLKVEVTVSENVIVFAARPRINKCGNRVSLPLPQGGRNAITKNPILREDQLPQQYLYPETMRKANKLGDDDLFICNDSIFGHRSNKKAPLQPPVRKVLAAFSGRRNPNDNHYSRSKH